MVSSMSAKIAWRKPSAARCSSGETGLPFWLSKWVAS